MQPYCSVDSDADDLALTIRHYSRIDPSEIVSGFALADALGIEVRRSQPPWVVGEAELDYGPRGWEILLRSGMPSADESFAVAHELGHLEIRRRGITLSYFEEEGLADRVAAALLMPIAPVLWHSMLLGPHFKALSDEFGTTQTCAALRFGEVTGRPVAVVGERRVWFRGARHLWPDVAELRRISVEGERGLEVVRLTDRSSRAAILAA